MKFARLFGAYISIGIALIVLFPGEFLGVLGCALLGAMAGIGLGLAPFLSRAVRRERHARMR